MGARDYPQSSSEPEDVTVKWFREDKGFGFVTTKTGSDLFVHISTAKKAGLEKLDEGQLLSIRRGPGRDGKEAVAEIIPA